MTEFIMTSIAIAALLAVSDTSRDNPLSQHFNCSSIPICTCVTVNGSVLGADCSNLEVENFPNFDADVVFIDLSWNAITEITTNTSIPDKVYHIDLSHNDIQYIDCGVLRQLPQLQYLDISYNRQLNFAVFSNISYDLQFTAIKVLKFSAIHCESGKGTTVRFKDFQFLSNTSLEEVSFASNRIEWVDRNIIRIMPKTVQKLDGSDNRFAFGFYMLEMGFVENLRELNLSYTASAYGINSFAGTLCWSRKKKSQVNYKLPSRLIEKEKVQPYIKQLAARSINFTIHFPRRLEVVDVSSSYFQNNKIVWKEFFYNFHHDIPNLRVFNYRGNFVSNFTHSNGFSNIEYMDLSDNYCKDIQAAYFENNTRLKYLKFNDNYLGDRLADKDLNFLFRDLRQLEFLDLSHNLVKELPDALMAPLVQMDHLNLAWNNMETVTFSLRHMQKLRKLDLSNNRIRFLSSKTMKELEQICQSHRITIDLSQNTLLCSCDTLPFLRWVNSHRRVNQCITFLDFPSYQCSYTNLTKLSLVNIDEIINNLMLQCSSKTGIIAAVTSVLVVFIGIMVSSIVYRYRWKLRYWYYTTKRALQVSNPESQEVYRYNVFLSYAEDDKDFALNEVLKTLEEDGDRCQVCFHERDFTPGRPIADNIAAAVHSSRFTVCVISKNYLDSYWCMYEFNLARMETEYARGGENALLLVVMNDLKVDSLPLILMDHMEKESYLEAPPPEDVDAKAHFLERLKNTVS